jgi:hypothetical protein
LGRDTLNIELITIDPKARKREVKIITHYEDFCKTGLDAIYQLWYNFWFFSDSVSATSIENRLFRYEDEGHIKRKTNNFIINDWDTSGIMIRRSVVDFKFDYEKYSFFENRQFHRLSNNSFMIAGEIGLEEIRPDGYNRLIYVSNFDRDGLKWFWKYESPPWNFNLYDMFINDSELTLIITGNQWNNYQKNLYKIIKLKI